MAFRQFIAAALLMSLSLPPAIAQVSLNEVLEPIRVKYGLPALAAAVVESGAITASGAVGTRVLGADMPVAGDDRFHLGSDTKAMTATIAASLVDEGRLRWDSTVGEVLGSVVPGLKPNVAAVTLERLLSHTSGFPSDSEDLMPLYFGNAYELTDVAYRRKILADWAAKNDIAQGGERPFAYSNLGYVTVGAMIEQVTGEAWDHVIRERIFAPLALRSAGLGPQATTGLYDAPVGHKVDEATGKATPHPWGPSADLPPVLGPAGLAHMSVGDFAIWAGWNAAEGKRGPAIVKPETLKRLHTQRVSMEIPDPPPGTPKSGGYAMGWGIVTFEGFAKPLLTHNGSNDMNLATIVVDPQDDIGITVVTNFPGRKADAALREAVKVLYTTYGPAKAP